MYSKSEHSECPQISPYRPSGPWITALPKQRRTILGQPAVLVHNEPLPRHCGHNHKAQTIGLLPGGGHATSPMAAYPDKMCNFLATHIFNDWVQNGRGASSSPAGGEKVKKTMRTTRNSANDTQSSSSTGHGAPPAVTTAGGRRTSRTDHSVSDRADHHREEIGNLSVLGLQCTPELASQA